MVGWLAGWLAGWLECMRRVACVLGVEVGFSFWGSRNGQEGGWGVNVGVGVGCEAIAGLVVFDGGWSGLCREVVGFRRITTYWMLESSMHLPPWQRDKEIAGK